MSKDHGFAYEPDKNGGQPAGYSPLLMNNLDGIRLNTGITFVNLVRDRRNLSVMGDTYARKVLFDGITVTGLEVERKGKDETLHADEVVFTTGAINTPHFLALSGIGPRKELEQANIPVIHELPGVEKDFTNHPDITINRIPTKAGRKLNEE